MDKNTVREYKKILVIAGTGLGNILLATPLIRSLKKAFPQCSIDVLVSAGRGLLLEGNPDVNRVIEEVRKHGAIASIRFLRGLFRRYDLALSTRYNDRSLVNAFLAAPQRHCYLLGYNHKTCWRKILAQNAYTWTRALHAVELGLRLADGLGIARCPEVIASRGRRSFEEIARAIPFDIASRDFAVCHVLARDAFKSWQVNKWRDVINYFSELDMPVLLTGNGSESESRYKKEVLTTVRHKEAVDIGGQFSFGDLATLLSRSRIFVGVDTGITHLAAAVDIPIVVLFGPTDPAQWGPWPQGYEHALSPYKPKGIQRQGNIIVVQKEMPCCPCTRGGCNDDIRDDYSLCMQEITSEMVLDAVQSLLS